MKYVSTEVVFVEIPNEITLAINISGCKIRCPDCHSKYLWDDIGDELTTDALNTVIEENDGVSCVCFMGGKFNEIKKLLEFIQNNHPSLRTAWYTGESELPRDNGLLELLDYIKIGPYIKDKGGLDSKGTNQRMYEVVSDKNGRRILNDITYKSQK